VVRRDPGPTERDGEHREADHPQPRDQHTRRFHAHQLALAQVRKHSHSDEYRTTVVDRQTFPILLTVFAHLIFAGLWIRIHFLRLWIRIRIQWIRMEANTDPDTDPDPIRIQGFNDQKLKKNYS